MCCFSRPIVSVSTTQIFARAAKEDRQYLVYSMNLSAKEDLAMVLPIPTPKAAKEDAVEFISLKEYPTFFADLLKAFPPPRGPRAGGLGKKLDKDDKPKLKVVEVGAYQASFVPTRKDFDRLDERFRLPPDALKALPALYEDWGFAVFKLKAGETKVHPMAFSFPRADRKRLFLPTIHIHDGKVHKTAEFDHVLYCQVSGEAVTDWEESEKVGAGIVDLKKAGKLIDGDGHVYRRIVRGRKENKDTWVV
jgi:hypothetical protein